METCIGFIEALTLDPCSNHHIRSVLKPPWKKEQEWRADGQRKLSHTHTMDARSRGGAKSTRWIARRQEVGGFSSDGTRSSAVPSG